LDQELDTPDSPYPEGTSLLAPPNEQLPVHGFRLSAAGWTARAESELERVAGRPGPSLELTATEQRVAVLAASGLTNREVAEQAFISPKTVEANLARAYRKLGISSRAELGAKMAFVATEPLPGPR